ncbi:MAG TPA: hypothetical protein VLA12_13110, partial [Planctomycetaceae bacterium]|nr:hypothetical protein [Planctomycetaceae bacterium]
SAGEHAEPVRKNIKGFTSLNWDTTLFDKEIVVLEMLENKVDELLLGFPKAALEACKYRSRPDQLAVRPLD